MRFAIVLGLLGLSLVVSIVRQARDAAGARWLLVAFEVSHQENENERQKP